MSQSMPLTDSKSPWLDGQFLVAMPGMPDERFARTVIYMCAHSAEGAMGLVINQPASEVNFTDLLEQLKITGDGEKTPARRTATPVKVLKGGPVQTERGFVLHSSDYFIGNSTLPINSEICLTATLDILRAIAEGAGPKSAVLALGYAHWAPGQLDREIQHNGWLNCPADTALIFDPAAETKYDRALALIGIDPAMLSAEAGHS